MPKPTNKQLEQKINDLGIYHSLIDNSPDLFYRTDSEGRISYVSASVYALSGYTVDEAIGMNMAQEIYLYPEQRTSFLELLKKNGRVTGFETRFKRKDGSVWWASTNASFYRDNTGKILGIEGMIRDITRFKDTQRALQESEERFRLTFHTSPDAINLNRAHDGMYLDINQGFTDLTGYTSTDIYGKTSADINIWKNPKDRETLVKELMETGHVKNLEAPFVTKNGKIIIALMSARIMQINNERVILSVTRDISERKKAQDMMIQTEKMMSLGGFAAGMAHEINNPLAGLMQSADVMIKRLTHTSLPANIKAARELGTDIETVSTYMEKRDILKMAETIRKTGARIAGLVDNMLNFARKSSDQFTFLSITDLLDNTIDLAYIDFDLKKIKINKKYEKNLPLVPCQADKIQQVFLNIMNNAAQASFMAKTRNPEIRLRVWLEKPAQMICVEIADNGPGMDIDTQKRIFEPFFTTKPLGMGTGLGLSMSYFIITELHKGEIEVDCESGCGTKMIIRLRLNNG